MCAVSNRRSRVGLRVASGAEPVRVSAVRSAAGQRLLREGFLHLLGSAESGRLHRLPADGRALALGQAGGGGLRGSARLFPAVLRHHHAGRVHDGSSL